MNVTDYRYYGIQIKKLVWGELVKEHFHVIIVLLRFI